VLCGEAFRILRWHVLVSPRAADPLVLMPHVVRCAPRPCVALLSSAVTTPCRLVVPSDISLPWLTLVGGAVAVVVRARVCARARAYVCVAQCVCAHARVCARVYVCVAVCVRVCVRAGGGVPRRICGTPTTEGSSEFAALRGADRYAVLCRVQVGLAIPLRPRRLIHLPHETRACSSLVECHTRLLPRTGHSRVPLLLCIIGWGSVASYTIF
jgi:hypothetical protein